MSIFSKICPRCAGDNAVDVSHCQCGFVFEASATTGSYRALEMAEQEAQVYAEYLQARMRQAKESVEVAINDQARFPGDINKAATARSANEEYNQAKAEYDEQMKLVFDLRKEADKARAQEQEQKQQENAWEKAKERTRLRAIQKEQEALAAKNKAKKEAAARKKKQQQARLDAARKTKQKKLQAEAAASAAAEKMAARQAGHTSPTPKIKEKMANDAAAAAARVRQAQSSIEKEMAAATSALNGKKTAAATKSAGKKPASRQSASAGTHSKTTRTKANAKSATNPAEKDCPNCTAIVAITAKKCKCGYGFPQGVDLMDDIGLSEEERANLLNVLQPGSGV